MADVEGSGPFDIEREAIMYLVVHIRPIVKCVLTMNFASQCA